MFQLIILIVAIYVAWRLFSNDIRKKKRQSEVEAKKEENRKVNCGEMAQDPECGAYVAVDGSLTVRDGDRIYHFCSYECRDKFLKRLEAGGRLLPEREEER